LINIAAGLKRKCEVTVRLQTARKAPSKETSRRRGGIGGGRAVQDEYSIVEDQANEPGRGLGLQPLLGEKSTC